MQKTLIKSLFIVVLGGSSKKANIEIHDIRWVIGKEIEDTFTQLREQWIGDEKGLHIDSYIKVKYIDGYQVSLQKVDSNLEKIKGGDTKKLWFVNLGGYHKQSIYELHGAGLVVANNIHEAKRKAKKNWLIGVEAKHNDNASLIFDFKLDANYKNKIIKDTWEIVLIRDESNRTQKMMPDWYGYLRIDN